MASRSSTIPVPTSTRLARRLAPRLQSRSILRRGPDCTLSNWKRTSPPATAPGLAPTRIRQQSRKAGPGTTPGTLASARAGSLVPAELGVVNLQPADPIEQPLLGAVGALVIEPPNAVWRTDAGTAAAATVFAPPRLAFREFVGVWQTQIDCTFYSPSSSCAVAQNFGFGPPTQVFEGLNYRAEPLWFCLASSLTFTTRIQTPCWHRHLHRCPRRCLPGTRRRRCSGRPRACRSASGSSIPVAKSR